MDIVKAGKPAFDLIKLCYAANRPILISGRHGVGKSELLEESARQMGIEFLSRDLSLMEPPDLIGLPKLSGKKTVFLPPSFLPTSGKGLLVFEELNRCERYMRAPCLQLLTSRTLNDYRLPSEWLPVAAINPFDEDYETSEIDPALLSRFVLVELRPDRKQWLKWAEGNGIHSSVQKYVKNDPSVFDEPESNPRSWTYVSDVIKASEPKKSLDSSLRTAVLGLVGNNRGVAFLATMKSNQHPLIAGQILDSYSKHKKTVHRWIDDGHLELVNSSLMSVLKHLQTEGDYKYARASTKQWKNLGEFFADLPGDLNEKAKKDFHEREYEYPATKKTRKTK